MSIAILNTSFGQSKIKAIKAGRLIDVVTGTMLTNQIILVDSNMIIDIGSGIAIPKDAEIIDLSKATVLPGLMDCHTHLTFQPGDNYYEDIFRKTAIDYAILAPHLCKANIRSWFHNGA
jgi:imidazolonepropionase-like amidohydrolase